MTGIGGQVWWVRDHGKLYGPLSMAQLNDMTERQVFRQEAVVWSETPEEARRHGECGRWFRLSLSAGLGVVCAAIVLEVATVVVLRLLLKIL